MRFYISKEDHPTIINYSKNIKGQVKREVQHNYKYVIACFMWSHFWEPLYVNFIKEYDNEHEKNSKYKVKFTTRRYQATEFTDYDTAKSILNDIKKTPDNFILQ